MNTQLFTARHWIFLVTVVLFFNVMVWGCACLLIFNRIGG